MHNKAKEMAEWALHDACAKGYDKMTHQDWDDFKDCVETAKNLVKIDYYHRIVEAMKKEEEEEKRLPMRMGYPVRVPRTGGGNSGGMYGQGGMWMPETDYEREMMERGRKGSGNSGMREDRRVDGSGRETGMKTRYGFSFDEYMEAREMYPSNDPDQKRIRIESLNRDLDELVMMGKKVVQDMDPEEKQVWKAKISKILNA